MTCHYLEALLFLLLLTHKQYRHHLASKFYKLFCYFVWRRSLLYNAGAEATAVEVAAAVVVAAVNYLSYTSLWFLTIAA